MASASVDYFLKIDGIDGESMDSKHKNEIDVLSFSWGATNAGSGASTGGRGAGKPSFQDITFSMEANKASPKLMLALATGEHIKSAVLTVRKAGGEQQEYMKVTFSDVLISSYQTGGSGGDVIPLESISAKYGRVEYEYKPQKPDGSLDSPVKVGYDLGANKKI
jgi:type VI secretion system secreted protein Hcp